MAVLTPNIEPDPREPIEDPGSGPLASRLRNGQVAARGPISLHQLSKLPMLSETNCFDPGPPFFRSGARGGLGGVVAWLFFQLRFLRYPRLCAVREPMSWVVPARVVRWSATSVVVLGAVHAVSGASGPAFSSALDVTVQVSTPCTDRIAINQVWPLNGFDAKPLPAGLTVNKKLGIISGKPTAVGTNVITITASQDNLPDRTLSDQLTLRVTAGPAPPLFSVNPLDTNVVAGSALTLTSEAIGTGTIRYQWYRGLSFRGNTYPTDPIPGATSPQLSFTQIGEDQGGYFFSSASNEVGTTYSVPALIGVVIPPVIDSPLTDLTVHEGASAWLYLYARGGAELNYQWRKDGREVTGETNAALGFFPVTRGDAGRYDVVLSNAAGRLVSDPATLQVVDPVQVRMTHTPAGSVALQFNSIPGRSYSVYYTDLVTNVLDSWFYLVDVTANATNTTKGVVITPPRRFYRVIPD